MKNFQDFLDECKRLTNSNNDSQMAHKIGMSRQTLHTYRLGTALPKDETITKLADRAGIDPQIALLWLCTWRSKGQSKTHYAAILKKLSAVFLVSLAFIISIPAQDANASIIQALTPETAKNLTSASINYAPYCLTLLKRVRV